MVEYIEKEAAQKIICGWCGVCKSQTVCDLMHCDDICPQFAQIPAADVREVVRGRWIEFPAALAYKDAYCDTHIVCSACEAVFDIMDNCTETFNFCPNCGADMRGGADGIH